MKFLKIVLAMMALLVLSIGAKADQTFTYIPLISVSGTVSGSDVLAGPSPQTYVINVYQVVGVPVYPYYTQHNLVVYDGCTVNGNYVYTDPVNGTVDNSSLLVTKMTSTEFDAYERTVFSSPLTPGWMAWYCMAYIKVQKVTVSGVQKTLVSLTVKNYKGQVVLNSSGYIDPNIVWKVN